MDKESPPSASLSQLDFQLPDFYRSEFNVVIALGGWSLPQEEQANEDKTQSRFIKLIHAIVVSGVPLEQAVALTCKVLRGLGWESEELDTLERYADQEFSIEASYPQIQDRLLKMNCKKIGNAVYDVVDVLYDQLEQFYVKVFRLALFGIIIRQRVKEQNTFVGCFKILHENLVHPSLAAAFTCCILSRFGFKDISQLKKYATPNYNLEQRYPDIDCRLTVAELFYSLERERECPNVIRIIARQDLNNYATDKITSIADFVQLLREREVIKVDNVTKLQELAKLCNRPTFFNNFCRRQNIPLIPLEGRSSPQPKTGHMSTPIPVSGTTQDTRTTLTYSADPTTQTEPYMVSAHTAGDDIMRLDDIVIGNEDPKDSLENETRDSINITGARGVGNGGISNPDDQPSQNLLPSLDLYVEKDMPGMSFGTTTDHTEDSKGQHVSTDEKTFQNLQEQNGAKEQVLKDPSTSGPTENIDVSHSIQASPPLDQRDGNQGSPTLNQNKENNKENQEGSSSGSSGEHTKNVLQAESSITAKIVNILNPTVVATQRETHHRARCHYSPLSERQRKNVPNIKCCVMTLILILLLLIGIVLVALVALGITTTILHFFDQPQSTGDSVMLTKSTYNRPMLVTSNSFTSATSINFTLLNPGSQSAALYQTPCNNLTLLTNRSLPRHHITQLTPGSFIRDDYNYDVGTDVPINLGPGSSLAYVMNANSLLFNPGCLRLFLFDSLNAYKSSLGTKNNTVNNYVARSRCINVSASGPPAQTIVVFNITNKQANYYVAVETPGKITFDANVSVIQTYYDTNGLKLQCSHRLSSSKPSCIINRCNHSFNNRFCFDIKKDNTCFLIDSTSTVDVTYQTEIAIFNGNSSYTFFATVIVFLLLAVLILLVICCCCCLYRKHKSDTSIPENYDTASTESDDRSGKKCNCV